MTLAASGFQAEFEQPSDDRWMYPHNATPGLRPSAPVFATWGDDSGVDTRHGQFLLGWSTTNAIQPGLPANHYRITRVRLTLTTTREGSFTNDSTPDAFETYLTTENPQHVDDPDPGRPIELFGAAFRNGFTSSSFVETSPFGSAAAGERNAFAVGFNYARELVDVSNNVGKTNSSFPEFPTRAFATGSITNVAAGEPVPSDSKVTFEVNLGDPDVRGYIRQSLAAGRLWFIITWLGESNGFAGTPKYPDFATRDNLLYDPPQLLIEGDLVGIEDSDDDGLPDDWERLALKGLGSSANDDDDQDGLSNRAEYELDTDPLNPESVLAVRTVRLESDGRMSLTLDDDGAGAPSIESSSDFLTWSLAPGKLDFPEPRHGNWKSDLPPSETAGYFRAVRPKQTPPPN